MPIKPRQFTYEEDELIREEYPKGVTAAELADKIGCRKEEIYRRADKLGIKSGKFKWTAEKVMEIHRLANLGYSKRAAAKTLGVSIDSINFKVNNLGIEFRDGRGSECCKTLNEFNHEDSVWTPEKTVGLIECWCSDYTAHETSKELGLSPQVVKDKCIAMQIYLTGLESIFEEE